MKNSPINTFKKIFNEEAENYFEKLGRRFIIDESNRNYFNFLCHYFSEDIKFEEEFGGDLKKGLMVFGDVGTGKSSSFNIIQNIYKKYEVRHLRFIKMTANEVVTKYNETPAKDSVIRYCSKGTMYFDDLGSEHVASNFGKEDIFIRILELRYNDFIEKGTKTYLTTNYTLEEIYERYGVRVFDRFKEMFNFLQVRGRSKRIEENIQSV